VKSPPVFVVVGVGVVFDHRRRQRLLLFLLLLKCAIFAVSRLGWCKLSLLLGLISMVVVFFGVGVVFCRRSSSSLSIPAVVVGVRVVVCCRWCRCRGFRRGWCKARVVAVSDAVSGVVVIVVDAALLFVVLLLTAWSSPSSSFLLRLWVLVVVRWQRPSLPWSSAWVVVGVFGLFSMASWLFGVSLFVVPAVVVGAVVAPRL
jgi:hypothetical protein